ncbi:unnamed protein product [Pseudo-nitzschia multistriata]|uniref:Divinyl chlorophyllide a 8-vinyl-reductase, chloroplastic n=1 Tax=Pseudo-nitzschia multistriata TaxID=183589 RepID=A0A448ZP17_9STRA|nr:unnamed protein product [Pseudo-nitzschia multistriata]
MPRFRFRFLSLLLVFLTPGTFAFVELPPLAVRHGIHPNPCFATINKDEGEAFLPGVSCSGERIAVVGATGYIGKAVVRESIRRGYPTTAVVRPGSNFDAASLMGNVSANVNDNDNDNASVSNQQPTNKVFVSSSHGAGEVELSPPPPLTVHRFDVSKMEPPSPEAPLGAREDSPVLFEPGSVDVVVCCLASRNGTPRESFAVDYLASLRAAEAARAAGARRFVLLSAYCVKSAEREEPHALQFQYAKKKLEDALAEMAEESNGAFSYVAVRPTAFFKSVSGQLEAVRAGGPFVLFDLGAGATAACNPISESDLASALIDQVLDNTHANTHWNLGGPDSPGLDKLGQMESMVGALGLDRPPVLVYVPIGVLHFLVGTFQWLADAFRSDKLADAAELARIVRYYAMEDMLTTSPDERYGEMTTQQHYENIAKNGQEYDPYTSAYGILKDRERILEESSKAVAASAAGMAN